MSGAVPLTAVPSIAVFSDRAEAVDARRADPAGFAARWQALPAAARPWRAGERADQAVRCGYMERLPLACVAAGVVQQAEVWHHRSGGGLAFRRVGRRLGCRSFALGAMAPRSIALDVPVAGLCLYPMLDQPGCDDDRPRLNGLMEIVITGERRPVCAALPRSLPASAR